MATLTRSNLLQMTSRRRESKPRLDYWIARRHFKDILDSLRHDLIYNSDWDTDTINGIFACIDTQLEDQ